MAELSLEVWSDILCPWCFIGSRHLAKALEETEHDVEVTWRAFQLDPTLDTTGITNRERLVVKFGGEANYQAAVEKVSASGERVGIDFDHARIQAANTLRAHQMIAAAAEEGLAGEVVPRLFSAQFEQGRNVADLETLGAIAAEAGLDDPESTVERVGNDDLLDGAMSDITEASRLGIHGIPTFVVDRKVGVSGAVPPDMLERLFDQAADDTPLA